MLGELIGLLIKCSEKAGAIARTVREDEELFGYLVEEKGEGEKNERFAQDFKTLADALIQECCRKEVVERFPEMEGHIYGEESPTFTSPLLGDSIVLKVEESESRTAALLEKVIPSKKAAGLLASIVHSDVAADAAADAAAAASTTSTPELAASQLGVWIDPIDATNEYVRGDLAHVTVLLGVFELSTGAPLGGVINQPFHTYRRNRWEGGTVHWGYGEVGVHNSNKFGGISSLSLPPLDADGTTPVIVVITSASEDERILAPLRRHSHFRLLFRPGAGAKLLSVILGESSLYILSKSSTHYWDTCGAHAILNATTSGGGGIVRFEDFYRDGTQRELSYKYDDTGGTHFANTGGLIAYRSKTALEELRKCWNT